MALFTITTDSLLTTVAADTADAAARQFAREERLYAGVQTAAELSSRAEELGGWARVDEAADDDGDYDLMDYYTGQYIRPASRSELAASIEAAKFDGGAGVIVIEGRSVYVQN